MKISGMLFAGLLSLGAVGAQAQFESGEVLSTPRLAGTFQRYDAASRVMRISDIEYAVSPNLTGRQQSRLRDLRSGRQVVFGVSDFDAKGRNIIVEIVADE